MALWQKVSILTIFGQNTQKFAQQSNILAPQAPEASIRVIFQKFLNFDHCSFPPTEEKNHHILVPTGAKMWKGDASRG